MRLEPRCPASGRRRFRPVGLHGKSPCVGSANTDVELDLDEKRRILGFYEEFAILINSGLLDKKSAFYMFGYYAVKCAKLEILKSYMKGEEKYWKVFTLFVKEMEGVGDEIDKNPRFDYGKIKV